MPINDKNAPEVVEFIQNTKPRKPAEAKTFISDYLATQGVMIDPKDIRLISPSRQIKNKPAVSITLKDAKKSVLLWVDSQGVWIEVYE